MMNVTLLSTATGKTIRIFVHKGLLRHVWLVECQQDSPREYPLILALRSNEKRAIRVANRRVKEMLKHGWTIQQEGGDADEDN